MPKKNKKVKNKKSQKKVKGKKLKKVTIKKVVKAKQVLPKASALKEKVLPPTSEADTIKKTKVRVIGIGGGAGNILSEISSKVKKATFVVANTDLQALKNANRNIGKFQFGQQFTHNLGTGMNTEIAKEAADAEIEKIKKMLQGQDLCIFVATLGGGAGSGAVPVFAKAAKSLGLLTLGIFTLPFKFEGERKMEIARESLQRVKPYLNTITILPNERIFQIIEKDTPLREAFSAIYKNLSDSLEGLIETIYQPGLINIDFADLNTVLQGQGRLTYLNTVEVHGANHAGEALKKVLASPLYPYTIKGAKGVLFNIKGEKEISLLEVSQISKSISEMANSEARIIFGVSQDKQFQDKIKITLLATGCAAKVFPTDLEIESEKPKLKKKKKKVVKKQEKEKNPAKPKRKKVKTKTQPKAIQENVLKSESLNQDYSLPSTVEVKVRKNALQVKKESEEAEKEILEKERFWQTPPFLRRSRPENPPLNNDQ